MYFLDDPHDGYISNVEGEDRGARNTDGPFISPYIILDAISRVRIEVKKVEEIVDKHDAVAICLARDETGHIARSYLLRAL